MGYGRAADYRRQNLWIELCYDWGKILANSGQSPIGECELELKLGSEKEFLELIQALEAQLGWKPWRKSKYARAKELMKGCREVICTLKAETGGDFYPELLELIEYARANCVFH